MPQPLSDVSPSYAAGANKDITLLLPHYQESELLGSTPSPGKGVEVIDGFQTPCASLMVESA